MSEASGGAPGVSASAAGLIFAVVTTAAALGLFFLSEGSPGNPRTLALWAATFIAGEVMRFQTPTGKGSVSMVAAVHLAGVLVLPLSALVVPVWASSIVNTAFVQRQSWYRVLFNTAQLSLAVMGASLTYTSLGGATPMSLDPGSASRALPIILLASAVYYTISVGLVSSIIGLTTHTDPLTVWRRNFGYRIEIVNTIALLLLAPVVAIAFETIGWVGLLVFILPMLFIRDACQRFIELERTHQALISAERLAAKGEMAASVGHELVNFLGVVNGNLQLFRRDWADRFTPRDTKRMKVIDGQLDRMSTLTRGLMDFARLETQPVPTSLGKLVQDSVEFLQPQKRLAGIQLVTEIDEELGKVSVDVAQIQQVLMNLLNNAADALTESQTEDPHILVWVRESEQARSLEIGVRDNGPGVPPALQGQVFNPSFTTKADGHGFGLSTVYRIVQNHGGSIELEDSPEGGATFRIQLPTGQMRRDSQAA